ncbi:hypothetical protein BGP77_15400 [Saccharospirillum sp. MSK14-1]|uniref:AzlC family ABC transporter permease n=1 Tax=Saccharospirillum sp. MSK14-1 TaxID=1897632 RepID=UPI000D41F68F|nr:AzlC family ABC transporter permease [Saccharospirillum sp. MSK14-1]PTY38322.1 hypothetical protein BGP77_15400 [Saccharospirillum sp. MSK14-1]
MSSSSVSHLRLWASGVAASTSLAVGYFPVAFSFGVVALQAQLSAGQALLISLIVFAGASQFVLVSLVVAGTSFWPALSALWMLNLRHLFYGPALVAQLSRPPGKWLPFIAWGLTDEMFATAMAESSRRSLPPAWCLGVGCGAYGSWVLGTLVGVWLGMEFGGGEGWFNDALSFVLPALFIALLGQAFERSLWPVIVSTVVVTAVALIWLPSHLALMVGMVLGACTRPLTVARSAQ